MIHYTTGNLLDADVDAVVNTVNTVGVMGKGIALMFKERFSKNTLEYEKACKAKAVQTGKMFVTETGELMGPRWVVNFPTKKHWRYPSKMEWIVDGLQDLKRFLVENEVKSIAIPPLGAGNGKLDWKDVKPQIEKALGELSDIEIIVYEPTAKYQNVAKKKGVEKLTPARALIAEVIRKYWVLGMECTLLEVQKLAWFLERSIEEVDVEDPLDLRFKAHIYGPYADRLRHLLVQLDGSYLHCDKRIQDASPLDIIWFEDSKKDKLKVYLASEEMKPYLPALERAEKLIDGFESPYGMELLATIDWLINYEKVNPEIESVMCGLANWPSSENSQERKKKLFDEKAVEVGLNHLKKYRTAA